MINSAQTAYQLGKMEKEPVTRKNRAHLAPPTPITPSVVRTAPHLPAPSHYLGSSVTSVLSIPGVVVATTAGRTRVMPSTHTIPHTVLKPPNLEEKLDLIKQRPLRLFMTLLTCPSLAPPLTSSPRLLRTMNLAGLTL